MKLLSLLLTAAFAITATPAAAFDHEHKAWTDLLKTYQTPAGNVRYKKLQADIKADGNHAFNKYLKTLSAVKEADYNAWDDGKKQAFLINAYNAFTIKLIVDHYPVDSIRDNAISGIFGSPWKKEFFSILGGKIKSLDPIEHEWLRPKYKDYRVHAAVNCASESCPPLRNEAFVGSRLNEQLDEQMQAWLKDPKRNQYEAAAGKLKISKLFDWYGDDFEDWGPGIKEVLKKYGPDAAKKAIANGGDISYLDYSWKLNDASGST